MGGHFRLHITDAALEAVAALQTAKTTAEDWINGVEQKFDYLWHHLPGCDFVQGMLFVLLIPIFVVVKASSIIINLAIDLIFELCIGIVQSSIIGLAGIKGNKFTLIQVVVSSDQIGNSGTVKTGSIGISGFGGTTCVTVCNRSGQPLTVFSEVHSPASAGVAIQPIAYLNLIHKSPLSRNTHLRIGSRTNSITRDVITEASIVFVSKILPEIEGKVVNAHLLETHHQISLGGSISGGPYGNYDLYGVGDPASISVSEVSGLALLALVLSPASMFLLPFELTTLEIIKGLSNYQDMVAFDAQEQIEQILIEHE